MLTALKWSGTSVMVASLAAATTVRVIAGGAGLVCAVAVAGSAIAPSNSSPVVLNCMIASQIQRMFEAPYALPTHPFLLRMVFLVDMLIGTVLYNLRQTGLENNPVIREKLAMMACFREMVDAH